MKCSSSVTLTKYESCVRSGGEIAFICDGCAFSSLPFIDDAGVSTAIGNSSPPIPNPSSHLLSCPIPTILNQKGLHFLHANVRSLIPKIPEIRLLLSRTKTAVFAATETWLDSSINDGEIHIPGYNVVRRDRNRNGGGVALFIRDDISFNPRPDLTVDGIEGLWIELLLPRSQGILLCCTYRPPNDSSFIHKFESALSNVEPEKEWFILGDFNIDMLKHGSSLLSHYSEILSLFGCEQVIDVPTRITPNSSSLIDHVVTNVKDLVQESGIINIGFSDHLVTYCTRKLQKSIFSSHSVKRIRNMKFYSGQFLVAELSKIDWSLILSSSNVDYCVKEFSRLFISAVDKVAPYREIRVRKNSSPWMNGIILASIKKRDRLFSRYKSDKGNETLYKEYCRVRNAVQRDIKQAKEIYFRNKVERNKDNSGKL